MFDEQYKKGNALTHSHVSGRYSVSRITSQGRAAVRLKCLGA
jgi:hypothetical protein